MEMLHFADAPAEALEALRTGLRPGDEADAGPALARSITCNHAGAASGPERSPTDGRP
jgi:hypothetical protein